MKLNQSQISKSTHKIYINDIREHKKKQIREGKILPK